MKFLMVELRALAKRSVRSVMALTRDMAEGILVEAENHRKTRDLQF
jgi:hypothetical protein